MFTIITTSHENNNGTNTNKSNESQGDTIEVNNSCKRETANQ